MREWLKQTHGARFELFRHFLRRFFESEMITSPEQTRSALIGSISLALPWFTVLIGPLKEKYAHFSSLAVPGPYREALRTDELWLVTMSMSIIGLLAAVKWQSLFPDLRDYRVLGSLPLRARDIFLAKFLALLLVAAASMIAISAIPAVAFAGLARSRWQYGPLSGPLAVSIVAGCGFFFFGLVALQGVLLNLLRPRAFRAATGSLQGLLVGLMLSLIVLSFSIQPGFAGALLQPPWLNWLPPIWYLGLCQAQSGNPDAAMAALAHRGWVALLIVAVLALSTYAVSYRRHRSLLVEGGGRTPRKRQSSVLLGWLLPDPRQQGVVGFMMSTLGRSGHHRMVLMGYGGLAFAIAVSGMAAFGTFNGRERDVAAGFVFYHMVAIVALLMGARHLFSRPTELKANWLFQLTERESRGQWLRAMDRLVFSCAAILWIAPLPVEIHGLAWRGVAEASLMGIGGLMLYDWVFSSWDKLPFTCSYVPGKTEGWMLALRFLACAALVPFVQGLLFLSLYNAILYAVLLVILTAAWMRFHVARREGWIDMRLKFEDAVDPAVHGLHLLR